MGGQVSLHMGERRLAHVVRSNRVTVAQIVEEVKAVSDRKVSEYTAAAFFFFFAYGAA